MSNNNNMNQCPICNKLVVKECINCLARCSHLYSENNACHHVKCSCGLKFHEHCLDRWHNASEKCPMTGRIHTVIRLFYFGTNASTTDM